MPTLTAQYELGTNYPCLLLSKELKIFTISPRQFNNFIIAVELVPEKGHREMHPHTNGDWATNLGAIRLQISRDEENIPTPDPESGKISSTAWNEWIYPKKGKFKICAQQVIIHIFDFFKHKLGSPIHYKTNDWDDALNNPKWLDQHNNVIPCNIHTISSKALIGAEGTFGTKALSESESSNIFDSETTNTSDNLFDQMICDARIAWYEGNMRRSILELAIATEISIKRRFFAASTPAGAAFDYLEDKGKTTIRAIDLIDAVAREAFSSSFKDDHPSQHKDIDHLFRCRNKIAHRGEAIFKDDKNNIIQADSDMVNSWYMSVMALQSWLRSQKP
jgi:hypothetical protein